MRTVLAIADSVADVNYSVRSDIRTIVELGLDPLAIVPVCFNADGTTERTDVGTALDFAYTEGSPKATRISYLSDAQSVLEVSKSLTKYKPNRVILTPSIISDSGEVLISEETYNAICGSLLSVVNLIILNHFEAELLCGFALVNENEVARAAKKIFNDHGCLVMIRGFELTEGKDFLFLGRSSQWIDTVEVKPGYSPKKYSFSMAIACFLANDSGYVDAVNHAKAFYAGVRSASDTQVEEKKETSVEAPKPQVSSEQAQASAPLENKASVPEVVFGDDSRNSVTSTVSTASLVSPAKSLRDIARNLDVDFPTMPKMPANLVVSDESSADKSIDLSKNYVKTAYTSAIEPPETKKGSVSDLSTQRSLENSLERLQFLRERLNQINQ